jgi:tetrahydromethanopterin S-methyltransferase subunit B
MFSLNFPGRAAVHRAAGDRRAVAYGLIEVTAAVAEKFTS